MKSASHSPWVADTCGLSIEIVVPVGIEAVFSFVSTLAHPVRTKTKVAITNTILFTMIPPFGLIHIDDRFSKKFRGLLGKF